MSIDVVTHSEVRRLAQSLQKDMGLQLRSRPVWKGLERFAPGIRLGGDSPYRMLPKFNPDLFFERVAFNGRVYIAIYGASNPCTSTDLQTWTYRPAFSAGHDIAVAGNGIFFWNQGSYNTQSISFSANDGLSWSSVGSGMATIAHIGSAASLFYAFVMGGYSSCYAFNSVGQRETVNLPETRQWKHVLHNGARWVVFDDPCDMAYASEDGKTNWRPANWLVQATAQMPSNAGSVPPRLPYALGSRCMVLGISFGGISSVISDDGINWRTGAMGIRFGEGLRIVAMGRFGAILDGALYVAVRVTDGTDSDFGKMALLQTPDGLNFRLMPSFYTCRNSGEVPPNVYARGDGTGIFFNAAASVNVCRFETDPDAMEIYHAL